MFLHEVAHPGISFSLEPPSPTAGWSAISRQLSQALTNIVKNAVEAIELRRHRGEQHEDGDRIDLAVRREATSWCSILTYRRGSPAGSRAVDRTLYDDAGPRGRCLGLAHRKKIVEEHLGEIAFLDRTGGGTRVRIAFDADRLAALATDEPQSDFARRGEDDEYYEEEPS